MKITQNDIFNTQTAQPFSLDSSYCEVLPDKELRPYIRCFWQQVSCNSFMKKFGTREENIHTDFHFFSAKQKIIIPDACMDIILKFDSFNNEQSTLCVL